MPRTPYRSVLSAAQKRLTSAIDQIRASIPHAGETGDLIERLFRSQLEEVLPEKIGVSNGFVVDSSGEVSRQMDIILYDRLNTPRIFTSDGAQMFPVETTYACGEVKTEMDSSKLRDSFNKCLSYKNLCRKAYITPSDPVLTTSYRLFGQEYDYWQSIFFCIAARSVSAKSLLPVYNDIVTKQQLKVNERIDTVVSLSATNDENILLNASGVQGGAKPRDGSIDFLPSAENRKYYYPASEPWSLFVILLLRYMTQAPTVPINMIPYGGNEPY